MALRAAGLDTTEGVRASLDAIAAFVLRNGYALNIELKLEVWDSPNSAGVVIDAIRCAKLAMDRKVSGPLIGPSAWFMKSPPEQFTDEEARLRTERFIEGGDAPRPPRLVS